jgi:hypothetical protein
VQADYPGTRKLIESINSARQAPLALDRLEKHFEKWWPELENSINLARTAISNPAKQAVRGDRELLQEILVTVRAIASEDSRTRVPHISLWIDSRPIFAEKGREADIYVPITYTISDLLDAIWGILSDQADMPPYRYQKLWVLRNQRTGELYQDIGGRLDEKGRRGRDDRSLSTLKVIDGDVLEVIPPSANKT